MPSPSKSKASRETEVTVSFSDSVSLARDHVQWTPKGVQLLTKWPFAVGAEVEFAFDHQGERHCCIGAVVACRASKEPAGFYEVVLYFIETPCSSAVQAACDCRLAAEEHGAGRLPASKARASRSGGG